MIDGSMTIGALTACMLLSTRAFQPIQSASSFIYNFATAKKYHERMEEVLKMPSEIDKGVGEFPKEIRGDLELVDLTFRWNGGDAPVIQDANVKIEGNQVIGIRGGPLSGTTSLLYLMMGKLRPEKGSVYIDETCIHKVRHDQSHGKIAFLSAEPTLLTGTIMENITMFNPALYSVAKHTANMIGLDQMVAPLPMGYETKVNPKSAQFLPTSLVHCVSLARILIIRPRILFLDKVTLSMDKDTENLFLEVIELMRRNCTIVFATNWPLFLSKCDRVFTLENGQLQSTDFEMKSGKA